jgi:nitroreductase
VAETPFDRSDVSVIAAAVNRAPSVHNSQPWWLEFSHHGVSVLERTDISLPRHDPTGRDRTISCGAALTHAQLAVRRLGRDVTVSLFPEPLRHNEVGQVRAGAPRPTAAEELACFRAISLRRSHRHRFAARPVAPALVHDLLDTRGTDGVQFVALAGAVATTALAELLVFAAGAVQDDEPYQRELAMWAAGETGTGSRDGFLPAPADSRTLPWAGLVDRRTTIPSGPVLAARLTTETQVLICTGDDGPADHLHAGMAMQRLWLALTARGLVASVLTQPLHVLDARAGLIARLELAGYPQVLMRIGHPSTTARSANRHPLGEIVRAPTPPQ